MLKKILYFLLGSIVTVFFLSYFYWNTDNVSAKDTGLKETTIVQAPRSNGEEQVISVYKKTNEAVVFITTVSITVDPFDVFAEMQPREGTGSGEIIDAKKGLILTNLHVVGSAESKVEVTLSDGKNYKAKLIGADPDSDIAVIQLETIPNNLTEISFGDSSSLAVGQRVLAIGNPFGLNRTLTTGIISSLDRDVKSPSGTMLRGVIQTDAAINPGNSGGPLLDTAGQLIGINSAILSPSGASAGIGFAVPVNQVKSILPELISTGKVRRPKMGWSLVDTNQGPMVLRVKEDSPAYKAGIRGAEKLVQEGFLRGYIRDFSSADLVVRVNEVFVKTKDEVEEIIRKVPRDQAVSLSVVKGADRNAEVREIKVIPLFD